MAHWIIRDEGSCGNYYTCSNCGKVYNDLGDPCNLWDRCPACGSVIKSYKNVYEDDLRDTPINHTEAIAVEPGPMKDVVILSIDKYDEMKADLVKLGEDLEVANRDKERRLDILRKIGIDDDNAKRIIPDTGELIDNRINPYTMRRKIILSFEVDDDRRV